MKTVDLVINDIDWLITVDRERRIIRDAGFRPAQRDTLYTKFFLN